MARHLRLRHGRGHAFAVDLCWRSRARCLRPSQNVRIGNLIERASTWSDVMNKIVRENYPASKLPEDLRGGIDPSTRVTVTVTVAEGEPPYRPMTLEEIFASR